MNVVDNEGLLGGKENSFVEVRGTLNKNTLNASEF